MKNYYFHTHPIYRFKLKKSGINWKFVKERLVLKLVRKNGVNEIVHEYR